MSATNIDHYPPIIVSLSIQPVPSHQGCPVVTALDTWNHLSCGFIVYFLLVGINPLQWGWKTLPSDLTVRMEEPSFLWCYHIFPVGGYQPTLIRRHGPPTLWASNKSLWNQHMLHYLGNWLVCLSCELLLRWLVFSHSLWRLWYKISCQYLILAELHRLVNFLPPPSSYQDL